MSKATDLAETHVSTATNHSPDCDGPYDETQLDSAQVTETINSSSALLRQEKRLRLRGDSILDNESTIQSYPQTPKSPVMNVDFLRVHSDSDHRNNMTREGTPMSMLGLSVPEFRSQRWRKRGDEAFVTVISALYAKILVIMGLAFPMSEVISIHVTSTSYLGFYIYLYLGSILYLLFVFFSLMRQKVTFAGGCTRRKRPEGNEDGFVETGFNPEEKLRPRTFSTETAPHYGSFYLRIGAVAFGVGSMIYSCLEFGQYFEVVDVNSQCHNILLAITPAARVLFTFIQMYFIFLNAKMTIRHSKAIAHFGLMHMIATNLCVWLNVIIEETKHEILFDHHEDHSQLKSNVVASTEYHDVSTRLATSTVSTSTVSAPLIEGSGEMFNAVADALVSALDTLDSDVVVGGTFSLNDECRRSEVLGNLVQEASPLLFPCAIEYSLICAAILYVMWKNLSLTENDRRPSTSSTAGRRSRHHYSVDCARANKGLFSGIFVLVLTIISLIMFFALINKQGYKAVAIMEVNMARLVLYSMAFIAVLIGLYQVREMRFDSGRKLDLDDVLLIFGQIGVISYNTFTIIASHFQIESQDTSLVLCTAIACLLQALTQTLFILDASRRNTYTSDQQRRKPGREVVTFLLVSNFAMWTVNTLEKSRADVNPVQLQFYGKWSWIIITNVSMPLAIFYRFHSTVVLCEIWKRCYKAKHEVP